MLPDNIHSHHSVCLPFSLYIEQSYSVNAAYTMPTKIKYTNLYTNKIMRIEIKSHYQLTSKLFKFFFSKQTSTAFFFFFVFALNRTKIKWAVSPQFRFPFIRLALFFLYFVCFCYFYLFQFLLTYVPTQSRDFFWTCSIHGCNHNIIFYINLGCSCFYSLFSKKFYLHIIPFFKFSEEVPFQCPSELNLLMMHKKLTRKKYIVKHKTWGYVVAKGPR